MAGLLAADEVAVLAHILPDVLVAHGGLFVAYAGLVQGLIQAEVAHYGGDEGIGIQPAALLHVAGAHIHYLVARDIGAVFVHGEAAVGVAVEGEAEVEPVFAHQLLQGGDVGGAAVHVYVQAVGLVADDVGICTQGVEHALGYHPGAAVGAVQAHLYALIRVGREADKVADVAVAACGIVHRAAYLRSGGMRRLRGYAVQIRLYLVQDGFLHLLALAVEQLYAVVMVWVMARAYHDAAVEVVHAGDVGDARRRRHVQ